MESQEDLRLSTLARKYRWKELQEELGARKHEDVAKALIDRYRELTTVKRKKLTIPERIADSSASDSNHGEVVMSGVELLPTTSDSEISLQGPSKKRAKGPVSTSTPISAQPRVSDSELSAASSVEAERKSRKTSVDQRKENPGNKVQNRSFSIRYIYLFQRRMVYCFYKVCLKSAFLLVHTQFVI
ncbi:uncharacterized protein LOC128551951 [Mercenaria mercenaria]|uniref:uncharacterized protein LOC128551951 n=1 Tax=Mercenaria mercenaria TaxID=6596 RepID=UPI00234F266E|nr:uncharacterized protein LOC128551951 [Mercenaria mercenaria]